MFRDGTQVATVTTTSFNDTGRTPGTTYQYAVRATDAASNVSALTAQVPATTPAPDTTLPSVPTGLTASAVSPTQINLSWTASTDNVGVTGYHVFRDGTQVATVTTTSFNDTGRTPGTTYQYAVRATDAANNLSALTAQVPATTPAADTTPPSVPTGLTASAVSPTQINLSWTASTDNVGVTGYQVFRDGAPVATVTTTSFNDTGRTPGTTYQYAVRATDAASNTSALTTQVPATTPAQASGLTAGYALNETCGTTTADGSGHGLTGTLTNGPVFAAGKYGNGIRLDGVNDFVNLGNPTALQLTGSMTISAWINSSAFPGDDAAIVSKRDGIGFQLDTTVDTGARRIGFKLTSSSGGDMFRYGATTLQANTWYYVTGVYDATARTLHVYLNGQLDDGALLGTVTAHAAELDRERQHRPAPRIARHLRLHRAHRRRPHLQPRADPGRGPGRHGRRPSAAAARAIRRRPRSRSPLRPPTPRSPTSSR